MHSWSLIKVLYTVRKCIWAPVAGAPLRHTGNGRLADSQSCYFRGSSGANQAGPGQLMDQWLYSSLHPISATIRRCGWVGGVIRVGALWEDSEHDLKSSEMKELSCNFTNQPHLLDDNDLASYMHVTQQSKGGCSSCFCITACVVKNL